MIGASKILTVSYGTFSCTLEGFDEPFNTMKAIAEYFRDLAAEDRYFGAEPPTPDTAMLHRIAEREVQRRVEARVQDNGVILRTGDAVPLAAPEGPAVVPSVAPAPLAVVAAPVADVTPVPSVEPVPEPVVAVQPEPQSVAVAEVAAKAVAVAEPETAPETLDDLSAGWTPSEAMVEDEAEDEPLHAAPSLAPAMPEGVAARLARLRRSVAAAAPVATVERLTVAEVALAPAEAHEDEPVWDLTAAEPEAVVEAVAVEPAPEPELVAEAADDFGAQAAAVEIVPGYGAEAEADPVEADFDAGELAAAEAELRDLLAAAEELTAAPEAETPVAVAETAPEIDALIASLTAEAAVAEAAPAEVEAAQDYVDPFADDPDFDEDETAYGWSEPVAEAGEADEDDIADLQALDGAADLEVAEAVVAEVEPQVEPEIAQGAEVPVAAEVVAEMQVEAVAEVEAAPTMEAEVAPIVSDKIQRARARVIKIRRADAPPVEPAAPVAVPPNATPDVDRLLRQADDEMSDPESKRRLAAIQHLKAAVAATVAERRAGIAAPSEGVREDAYRADLARVVRPVRPSPRQRPGAAPELNVDESFDTVQEAAENVVTAPEAEVVRPRPAPLVLVMEQRIDRPTVSPVRPLRSGGAAMSLVKDSRVMPTLDLVSDRRIDAEMVDLPQDLSRETAFAAELDEEDDEADDAAAAGENIFADARGFEEFAERLGAQGLPDLLEAAAAYATCIEGRDHFTRPLLMRRIAAGQIGASLSREDGLRSFGTLLRDGRIAKVRRGQYALTEGSTYLAEARRLAD